MCDTGSGACAECGCCPPVGSPSLPRAAITSTHGEWHVRGDPVDLVAGLSDGLFVGAAVVVGHEGTVPLGLGFTLPSEFLLAAAVELGLCLGGLPSEALGAGP